MAQSDVYFHMAVKLSDIFIYIIFFIDGMHIINQILKKIQGLDIVFKKCAGLQVENLLVHKKKATNELTLDFTLSTWKHNVLIL